MLRRLLMALFVLLSLADFGLTWFLIEQPDPGIYEGNPAARWWLAVYGWMGLFTYKAATVLTAALIVGLIAQKRPRLAAHVMAFACLALTATVVYSGALAVLRSPTEDVVVGPIFEAATDHGEYLELLDGLRKDVAAGRTSLRDAARTLEQCAWARNPEFARTRGVVYPGRREDECFGAILLIAAVSSLPNADPQTRPITERLLGEFEAAFGTTAPWSRDELLQQTRHELDRERHRGRGPYRPRWGDF